MESSVKRNIAYALRRKGIAEPEIPRHIRDATNLQESMGERFSTADFVAGTPRGTHTSKGAIVGRIAAAFLLLGIGLHLLLSGVFGVHLGVMGLVLYYIGVLLGLAALVFSAYYLDRKLPES
ncbi:hypothetical protein ACIQTZ_13870 [Paenarthrobacter sp. NPDC090520]|uniref:hypothetical protein n=1 Tax=unclassified Paenarthrobacter TaxID=2634190 RepID=UPI003825EB17